MITGFPYWFSANNKDKTSLVLKGLAVPANHTAHTLRATESVQAELSANFTSAAPDSGPKVQDRA